ncbi:MAG: GNAT family N-acetyltransferase [Chloroflexi bacterium]|nr:GNAT family N-acetyltransferase [Chloroflexota bacterium]
MIAIRPFSPPDANAVYQIGADTARYGDPVELILNDRRLFIDIFMRPYLTHYPETCWVAEVDGQVVGYLTGCPDTASYEPLFRRAVLRAARDVALFRYRIGWRTARAAVGFMREVLAHPPTPNLEQYPAHLHVNLAAPYRGQGAGRCLMLAYLDHLRDQGIPGAHLNTSDQNTVAVHLYEKLGFTVLHRYHSPYQSIVSRKPVDGLLMGLRLDGTAPDL